MLTAKETDSVMMLEALRLARKGFGRTSPNPMVGALVVRDGVLAGRGCHLRAGLPHAEINAINDAGGVPACAGADLYVTLEPCSTMGRTPPCTDEIIKARFGRVVIGTPDPNPSHSGRALGLLEKAGIKVVLGVEEQKCRILNEAFNHWIVTGRPFVLLKLATTLDGRIATSGGLSRWITGEAARHRVQHLRKWSDAIMVGADTARSDRPSLTVRSSTPPFRELRNWHQPERIVASSAMDQVEAVKLLAPGKPPIVVSAPGREEWLRELERLGGMQITALLVEGGGGLAASLLEARLVNRAEFHISTKIMGGTNSVAAVGGESPESLEYLPYLADAEIRRLGKDICISGLVSNAGSSGQS